MVDRYSWIRLVGMVVLGSLAGCSGENGTTQKDANASAGDADKGADVDDDTATCDQSELPDERAFFEFYEICVPDDEAKLEKVRAILAAVGEENYVEARGSAGMIRCDTSSEVLFHDIPRDTPLEILCALTVLPYIEQIGGGVYL